jgi:hypothetical protein
VPDEVGGRPFPDGEDHGGADEEFAAVVLDEAFVKAAFFHEPSAHERMLAAARTDTLRTGYEEPVELAEHDDDDSEQDLAGEYDELYAQRSRSYRGHARWHRSVAWVLAVVMGVGVVALTFAAVYRGAGGGRQPSAPPAAPTGRVGAPTIPPVAVSPSP